MLKVGQFPSQIKCCPSACEGRDEARSVHTPQYLVLRRHLLAVPAFNILPFTSQRILLEGVTASRYHSTPVGNRHCRRLLCFPSS